MGPIAEWSTVRKSTMNITLWTTKRIKCSNWSIRQGVNSVTFVRKRFHHPPTPNPPPPDTQTIFTSNYLLQNMEFRLYQSNISQLIFKISIYSNIFLYETILWLMEILLKTIRFWWILWHTEQAKLIDNHIASMKTHLIS